MDPTFIMPPLNNVSDDDNVNLSLCITVYIESGLKNGERVYFIIFRCLNGVTVKWKFFDEHLRNETIDKILNLNCFRQL